MGVKDLSPEFLDKLKKIEDNKPSNKQVRVLNDIASMTQELISVVESAKEDSNKFGDDLAPLLLDMRQSLEAIRDTEPEKQKDYSKPVVEALKTLEKQLSKSFKDIKLPTPQVKVDAPKVNVAPSDVDLRGIEKILKTMPKAFEKAIKLIPESEKEDYTPLIEGNDRIVEMLQSIDTATRIKTPPAKTYATNSSNQLEQAPINALVPEAHDYLSLSQTATVDTWTYKTGGSGGTLVATVTITYTDSTKDVISTVVRT